MIKKFVLMVFLVFCIAVLTACNTMQGLGKDIESAGEAIERAADKK